MEWGVFKFRDLFNGQSRAVVDTLFAAHTVPGMVYMGVGMPWEIYFSYYIFGTLINTFPAGYAAMRVNPYVLSG
jgi:hypothetical protein